MYDIIVYDVMLCLCSIPESLVVVPISQSSALQRAGRAGRVRPGKVFRLYTGISVHTQQCSFTPSHIHMPAILFLVEDSFHKLQLATVPEMQRSNLAPVILQLKALGVDNVLRFHFLSVSAHISKFFCTYKCMCLLCSPLQLMPCFMLLSFSLHWVVSHVIFAIVSPASLPVAGIISRLPLFSCR